MLTTNDTALLRDLAQQLAGIAALPVQKEKTALWLSLNTVRMQRPMVLIDQIPWNEMDTDGSLVPHVSDEYWRNVEIRMRQSLYKWKHFPVDMVINPYICLPRPIINSGWGIQMQTERMIRQEEGANAASYQYQNQIREPEDLEKIRLPKLTLDTGLEQEIIERAHLIFDGIIPFRMTGMSMHLGLWDWIAKWMGVENCYIELMDRPEMMHALMEKLTVGVIGMIRQLNEFGGFDIYSHVTHCSQTFLPDLPKEGDEALSGNSWAFGLAQLFTAVSPEITREFELPYMKRIFPYFGAIYYGCCDRLDDRMEIVEKLPKIRKLSCSPWSEREHFAEVMPDYCVMSNKPNPAFLAAESMNEEEIRKDLRRTINAAKSNGRSVEFILKDISTVRRQPERLERWAKIAMDEVLR